MRDFYVINVNSIQVVRDSVLRYLVETWAGGHAVTYQHFTDAQFVDFARQRVNRFLLETGVNPTVGTFTLIGDQFAPSAFLSRLRLGWAKVGSATPPTESMDLLEQLDQFQYRAAGVASIGPPFYLLSPDTDSATQPLYRVIPATTGTLAVEAATLLYDESVAWDASATTNPADATPAYRILTWPIPLMFQWGIVWGVIADLLSAPGQLHDPERASYAEGRWNECVALAKMWCGDLADYPQAQEGEE